MGGKSIKSEKSLSTRRTGLVDRAQVIFLTQEWKGECFKDGRPKVSDDLLKRVRNVATGQAWSTPLNALSRAPILRDRSTPPGPTLSNRIF